MRVKISMGNSKIGKIPNVSLPPGRTCRVDAPCATKECYCLKGAWKLYKCTRDAWTSNLDFFSVDPRGYFQEISGWLALRKPKRFRWHIGGDIVNPRYLEGMIHTAVENPGTKFLVFTKKYELVNLLMDRQLLPTNLTIVFSGWPGLFIPNPWGMPIAWCRHPVDPDPRIPEDAVECSGSCENCSDCWDAADGSSLVFNLH